VGVGGVTVPEDFEEYRAAGADIVMSATGAMWNPYLAKEIKENILKLSTSKS
jgi:dihydroorotate dehydrogenase